MIWESIHHAEGLIHTSTLCPEEQGELEKELRDIDAESIEMLIEYLYMNQQNIITERGYLSQKAIIKHLERYEN